MQKDTYSTLVFTDIHWGLGQNSEAFIKTCNNTIDMIISLIQTHDISNVIFAGDWFHQRTTLDVNVLNHSYNAIQRLSEACNKLYMIVGNHDTYFKNSIDVNSIKLFNKHKNVHIIQEPTYISIDNKKVALIPWATDISVIDKDCDYMFGHFEPNGAVLMGRMFTTSAYSNKDLTDICPKVFSGHFHERKVYNTQSGTVNFIGAPFQQNYGDADSEHGVVLMNFANDTTQFIENIEASRYVKLLYSRIISREYKLSKKDIANNYVKLIIDCEYDITMVQNIINKCNQAGCINCNVDYIFFDSINPQAIIVENSDIGLKTHVQYIKDFVENPLLQLPEDIDRDKLTNMVMEFYNQASTKEETQEAVNE